MPTWFNAFECWTTSAFFSPLAKEFQMKDVHMQSVRILFAAAATAVGSFTFVTPVFGADPVPADTAKAVERAADKTVDAAKDTKAAADQLTGKTAAMAQAPAADEIRNTLASTTEAAVTKGGFKDVVKHFVDADRTRLGTYTSSDGFAKLDGRIDSFRKDWQSKYGQDFSFSKNANAVLVDSFARISQGEIGEARTAAGKEVPSNEPKVNAGTAEALQKSGVSNTDLNSGKMGGGDTNKDIGRNIATVLIPASAGAPELAIPLIHELPNSWQIDLPDNIDGQKLQDNLLKHLTMVDEDRTNWPADVNDAYRGVTRHVMTAIMESDGTR
jgi:hypothetical protein